MDSERRTRKPGRGARQAPLRSLSIIIALLMVSVCFSVPFSEDAQALDFVETIPVPWTSDFTPLDSAWDANGTQCVVVGNDTSGIQPSAWLYNDPSSTWYAIHQGTDPSVKSAHNVTNVNTSMRYPSIQAAINTASPGNVLEVWAGTYNEQITIGKPLTITGNGSANTIINGNGGGNTVYITANGVTFGGFTVTGGTASGMTLYKVQDCRIENCTVEGNGDGICLRGSSDNIIKNNNIRNNAGVGVRTEDSETAKSLVGFTNSGGEQGYGTMFMAEQSGANYSVVQNFNYDYTDGRCPMRTQLIQDTFNPNYLYGMTQSGGHYDKGTIFRVNKDGTGYSLLHTFGAYLDGQSPTGSLVQSGSVLYGMTPFFNGPTNYGSIFRINTDGTGYSVLHNFTAADGTNPEGSLIFSGATLYGLARLGGSSGLGTIFRMNMDGTGFTVMLSFTGTSSPNYGSQPYGSLKLDTNTGTTLYGLTYNGGSLSNYGNIFRINIDGTGFKSMLNFTGTALPTYGRNPYGNLIQNGNILYGMTRYGGLASGNGYGVMFRVNTDGSNYKCLYNFTNAGSSGYYPYGSLVLSANYLYGMTYNGGSASNYGTVFSFNIGTSSYLNIHPFTGVPDGRFTYGSLYYDSTYLYGMTYNGGNFDAGTIFRVSTDGLFYQKTHDFDNTPTNGINPYGKLTQSGQYLYGVARSGGISGFGFVFRTDLDGNGYTILHNFFGGMGDGRNPYSCPIVDSGVLYGTTSNGGINNCGTVYRMNLDGSGFMTLHEFANDGTDGQYCMAPLTLVGGILYGTTNDGGMNWAGIIFSVDTAGVSYQILYQLTGMPGALYPMGALVSDGTMLYGTSSEGGDFDYGCIFSAACDGSAFTVLHSFSSSPDGSYPYGGLAFDGNNLYGSTEDGGANNYGTIFRIDTTGSSYTILRSLSMADGRYPECTLTLDGTMLYGMTNGGGGYSRGTVFRMNKDTMAFSVIHDFAGSPSDGQYPYYCDISIVINPAQSSANNLIFHNNFIDNAVQALNDDPPANIWNNVYPTGGNYWSDYTGADIVPVDGIGDTEYTIPAIPLCMDSYPFMIQDGWAMPYTTFRSVGWDGVHQRFWICGEMGSGPLGEFYYIPACAPTTMVPIFAPPITFTALAVDEVGNVLIGANNQMAIFYYSVDLDNGYSIVENGTGGMYGWNITGMTFNPYDNRFYIVGTVTNMDVGVAFVTDPLPLNQSGKKCYIDTSDFMNSPGIGGLRSISWNPMRNYSIAVGDGVYRLNPYNGNPARQLSWSTISAPQAGMSYYDISWDRNGWNEAGIVGRNGTYGTYWRYYHTNQHLIVGNTSSTSGTNFETCAMKPPSSPKWLLVPYATGCLRVNIQEKDESGIITFSANKPQIFSVKVWKQSDLLQPNLLNTQVEADSTYTFFIEGNYTVGGVDMWSTLMINIAAWYDNGQVGTLSQPQDPSWSISNFRTRQFNVTYDVALGIATIVYPTPPPPIPPVREFYVSSYWSDPLPHGSDGYTHRVYVNITFNKQTYAADGTGFVNGPATGGAIWNKAMALNDPGSWDMQVHIFDTSMPSMYNITWEEFGIKQFASISSTGSPTGSAPPGEMGYYLGSCQLHYSSNVAYFVTVSIPDLHMNGDLLNPKYIPVNSLCIQNFHSLATGYSDIESMTYFSLPNSPLNIWGTGNPVPTPITVPIHGTESSGPLYSDYTAAAMGDAFEYTEFGWWIDVPVSVSAGVYRAIITVTITD